jgi:hypothetical protein
MANPMRLFVSPLTNKVYASSAYKIIDGEKGHIQITGKKYDVTDDFMRLSAPVAEVSVEDLKMEYLSCPPPRSEFGRIMTVWEFLQLKANNGLKITKKEQP